LFFKNLGSNITLVSSSLNTPVYWNDLIINVNKPLPKNTFPKPAIISFAKSFLKHLVIPVNDIENPKINTMYGKPFLNKSEASSFLLLHQLGLLGIYIFLRI